MGIFTRNKSKQVSRNLYEFTDEDRQQSVLIRKQKQENKLEELRLQQENIRLQIELKNTELRARIADYLPDTGEDGLAEGMFMPIITKALEGFTKKALPNPSATSLDTPNSKVDSSREPLTDDQLRELKKTLPKAIQKYARTCDDETLKKMILSHIPDASEQEIERALIISKE